MSSLLCLLCVLTSLARTQDTAHGPPGMIFLTLPTQLYAVYTPTPYISPQPPGDAPAFPPFSNPNEREQVKLIWGKPKME